MKRGHNKSAYAAAGVDIDVQERALERIKELARETYTPGVLSEIGAFGGLFRPDLESYADPVLVASADGVGTKLEVARLADDYSSVGRDLVNHCVNDILVQGARPLFFLDYVGAGVLEPDEMVQLVGGVATGCRENGCALLGGETSEMPGLYQPGSYELVGFIVGMVEQAAIFDGSRVEPQDVVVALESAGLHTNGYTLARRVLLEEMGLTVTARVPVLEDRRSVGELLLAPHLSYLAAVTPVLEHPALHAMAHITGGGLSDNLPRVLPDGCRVEIRVGAWEIPELFYLLQERGEIDSAEMFRVFNMGVGYALIVSPEGLRELLAKLRESGARGVPIGTVQEGGSGVVYDFSESRMEDLGG